MLFTETNACKTCQLPFRHDASGQINIGFSGKRILSYRPPAIPLFNTPAHFENTEYLIFLSEKPIHLMHIPLPSDDGRQ